MNHKSLTANILGFVTYNKNKSGEHTEITSSRRYRKNLSNHHFKDHIFLEPHKGSNRWLKFFSYKRIAWWIAINFMLGSLLFAVGSFSGNHTTQLPSIFTQGNNLTWVFFIGSLFFTAAAGLQLLEVINSDINDLNNNECTWRWWAWKPKNAGYIASLIQFLGTILFNVNTAMGFDQNLTETQLVIYNWGPDAIGSAFFLIASYIAMIEVTHKFWSLQPKLISWWIVFINLLGSIAFGIAAIYTLLDFTSSNAWWNWGLNTFTLIGAICFFIASYLLIPELFDAGAKQDAAYIKKVITTSVRDNSIRS